MNFSFLDIFLPVLTLILMLIPGFVLRKLKLVYKIAVPSMVAVLIYVCQPVLTIRAFVFTGLNPLKDTSILINIGWMFLLSALVQVVMFFLARLVFLKVKNKDAAHIYIFCAVFSNSGFIGIPLIDMLYDGNPDLQKMAVLFAAVFVLAFNMLIWTIGVYIITGDKKSMKIQKAFLNPATVTAFIAIPLFLFPQANIFTMHSSLEKLIRFFADMTTPLSMLIIGFRLAEIPFREIFNNPWVYVTAGAKLLAAPLVTFAIVYPLQRFGVLSTSEGGLVFAVLFILMAIPTAASTIALSEKFRGDTYTAVKCFLANTLMSIGTLPLMLVLFSLLTN